MSSQGEEIRICAIGLDHFGYRLRPKTMEGDGFRIDFFSKDEALACNLDYDALIIASGIFERFSSIPEKDGPRMSVQSDPEVLKKMETRLNHHLDRGKWVCFLADEIVDRINEDHPKIRASVVNDTDLSKRFLNRFAIQRSTIQTSGALEIRSPAFVEYGQKYATPKTIFSPPADLSVRELVRCSAGITGFSLFNQLFFLPFFKNYSRSLEVSAPIVSLYQSIQSFLEDPNAQSEDESQSLPSWVDNFHFHSEKKIADEQKQIKEKLDQLKVELQAFKKFKHLLTQTGSNLQSCVELSIKEYFQFDYELEKNAIKLKDKKNNILAVICADSCQGSVQRANINEVDNTREKIGLKHSLPGVLLINDKLEANSLEEKEALIIEREMLEHSRRQNVIIMRSIHFLNFMRELENESESNRQREFLRILSGERQISSLKIEPLTEIKANKA